MKTDSTGNATAMPMTLEQAAMLAQHEDARDQVKSSRVRRHQAQQDVIQKQQSAATKLHEMADMTRYSGLFQAGMAGISAVASFVDAGYAIEAGNAPAALKEAAKDTAKRASKIADSVSKLATAGSKLDGFAWKKADLEAERRNLAIEQHKAEEAVNSAEERIQD